MIKIILTMMIGIGLTTTLEAGEKSKTRQPAAELKGDSEVDIKSYGGNYPQVLRIIDTKNKVICFAVTNSNNGSGIACQPLTP